LQNSSLPLRTEKPGVPTPTMVQ